MELDDIKISRAIIDSYTQKLLNALEVDVAIVGGGPAGITCGYYLAKRKIKVILIERKLSIGGGMWGGGMMFNEIVVQDEARKILDEFGVKVDHPGFIDNHRRAFPLLPQPGNQFTRQGGLAAAVGA